MQLLKATFVAIALIAPTIVATSTTAPAHADGTSYYFSPNGSDSASGTSPDAPWRSLSRAASLQLAPGDRIELMGGTTYADGSGLTVDYGGTSAAPVVVESYGSQAAGITGSSGSCVHVAASNVVVRRLVTAGCGYAGVEVGGDFVRVEGIDAFGSETGVAVGRSASYTSVTGSQIHDNTRTASGTSGSDDDSGAFGVLVSGDHTTVSGNTISGHDVASPDYGRDGSAVEVFGATNTTIADNRGADNQTFLEVGGLAGSAEAAGVVVRSNQVTSAQAGSFFAVVHAGDGFGTASGVQLVANAVDLTGGATIGVAAGPSCTPAVLAMSDNTITVTQRAVDVGGTYASSGDQVSP